MKSSDGSSYSSSNRLLEKSSVAKASHRESALTFNCSGHTLVGILHEANYTTGSGVLIVVGGRQYRAGAHRQFVSMARYLASHGISVLRFDVRGMGDSDGATRHFLALEEDIGSAISIFKDRVPRLKTVALWGLCDGASAAILFAKNRSDIAGVMLVNPWITTESGKARTYLKHYYLKRFASVEFWRKALSGNFKSGMALLLIKSIWVGLRTSSTADSKTVPDIVFSALESFKGVKHIIISDRDLTGREFEEEYRRRSPELHTSKIDIKLINVTADHTFSSAASRHMLCQLTLEWVNNLK